MYFHGDIQIQEPEIIINAVVNSKRKKLLKNKHVYKYSKENKRTQIPLVQGCPIIRSGSTYDIRSTSSIQKEEEDDEMDVTMSLKWSQHNNKLYKSIVNVRSLTHQIAKPTVHNQLIKNQKIQIPDLNIIKILFYSLNLKAFNRYSTNLSSLKNVHDLINVSIFE